MANKMLIDASHPEETRVVVSKGNRIEEFDFESEHKKQIKGNIYLAKVTRVEPSLQAAFVEYGGNRHGFLAFSEIHPDYYQIPIADRQALIEEELARAAEDEDRDDSKASAATSKPRRSRSAKAKAADATEGESVSEAVAAKSLEVEEVAPTEGDPSPDTDAPDDGSAPSEEERKPRRSSRRRSARSEEPEAESADDEAEEVDDLGAEDAMEEVPTRQRTPRRQYKIQEVIKRRQILLVQVVKEERGNKGAALTTYLSLAGRYSVLMPNTARGGGISRKITNAADRKRLKEVARDLEVPKGMGIILRTAGANRTRAEVKRDYEYLMRLWEAVRTLTLSSTAPALVYEEGSLIKRSIRDLYNKDIDQILVSGEAGYREAKDFMRMLMPSQAKVVQPYRDPSPIFARQGIEAQLDKMLQPNVTLKSGGYIIINQTEALVAIDVNSGRSTREHSVEDTAYQTNLEAAEEVARQLRLRDMAGLIVIDFIDMEEKRNNRAVEKKLKECLKDDRARIQLGRISHFGLMEMSRQRIRASVLESTMQTCPLCDGAGHIRSASSLALHALRTIEEHLQKHATHDLIVKVPTATALYVLNEKRSSIDELERHYGLRIVIEAFEGGGHQHIHIEHGAEAARRPVADPVQPLVALDAFSEQDDETTEDATDVEVARTPSDEADASSEGGDDRRRRRRRRGRRRGGEENGVENEAVAATDAEDDEAVEEPDAATDDGDDQSAGRKRRRRGRRGGRRGRSEESGDTAVMDFAGGAGADEPGYRSAESMDFEAAERSPDPEMVPAVDALSGADAGTVDDPTREAAIAAVPADENEVEAAEAEAGASLDSNQPLDEVFPAEEDATGVADEIVESEIAAAHDQPDSVTREPRITANGGEAAIETEGEAEKPKRTGWWARRSFF